MKIVHLSTNDVKGGAARSAHRLHQGLQRIGWSSTMLVADKTGPDRTIVRFEPPQDFLARVRGRIRRDAVAREFSQCRGSRPSGYELFCDDRAPFGETLLAQIPSCDVVNMYWVAGMVDYTALFSAVPFIPEYYLQVRITLGEAFKETMIGLTEKCSRGR